MVLVGCYSDKVTLITYLHFGNKLHQLPLSKDSMEVLVQVLHLFCSHPTAIRCHDNGSLVATSLSVCRCGILSLRLL